MYSRYLTLIAAVLSVLPLSAPAEAQTASTDKIEASDMPRAWQYSTTFDQTSPTDDIWWQLFGDPTLDSLISIGISNNYDVVAAHRRIEMARQSLRQVRSAYFPAISVDAGWNKARTSGATASPVHDASTVSYFDLGLNMNWEIDVFGKIMSKAKQSKAAYHATRVEYDATMVTVAAKIATAYMQLRTIQAQQAVLERNIESQHDVLKKTEARYEAGLSSKLDVTQAGTTYYSTVASLANLRTSETSTINALAMLLGAFPADIDSRLRQPAPMPDYRQLVSVGVPMQLLRRRPDIVEAEYTLAQYAAAIGIAKKDFLPTLSLAGSIGTAAHDFNHLFSSQSINYTIAPTLSWTLFSGFARTAALASAKEQLQIGIDNYNLTLINAVQEVETAMTTYINDLAYIEALDKVIDNARESLTLSIDQYKQGLISFINVNDAQISYLSYSSQLVQAQGSALTALVNLYEALGGGWQWNPEI